MQYFSDHVQEYIVVDLELGSDKTIIEYGHFEALKTFLGHYRFTETVQDSATWQTINKKTGDSMFWTS